MRRAAATVVLAAALAGAAAPAVAAAATGTPTVGPARTAWYDVSTLGQAPAAPPAAPGSDPRDLVVSGATVSTAVVPASLPGGPTTVTRPTAITAMLFRVPAGTSPAVLTLPLASAPSTTTVDGRLPVGVTPVACAATTAWHAGGSQPGAAAPSYDCTKRTSIGHLNAAGSAVVFSDIGVVAQGKLLSFVIVPGTIGADRLVFAPPTSKALSLLTFDTAPTFTSHGSLTAAAPASPPSSAVGGPAPAGTAAAGVGAGVPALSTPSAGAAPALASGARPAASTAAPPSSPLPDDARVRLVLAAGAVALVAAAGWLAVTDGTAGRRTTAAAADEWGIGRSRRPRTGPAPSI